MNLMSAPQSTTCLLFCHCTCDCHVQCPWPPCSQPAALQLSKYCVSGCLSVWFRLKEYTRRHSAGQCRVNRRAVTCVIICRQPRFLLSSLSFSFYFHLLVCGCFPLSLTLLSPCGSHPDVHFCIFRCIKLKKKLKRHKLMSVS